MNDTATRSRHRTDAMVGQIATAALLAIVVIQFVVTVAATRHISTTFDEIVFLAVGARGLNGGGFDLVDDHPPLPQILYGLPVHLARPVYPDERNVPPDLLAHPGYRYLYSQQLLFGGANDPEQLAFRGRIVGAAFAAALTCAVFIVVCRRWGAPAALLAASLVAFLPDVLAHGGIAYNDLPLAVAVFVAVFAIDAALRRPAIPRAALAGAAIALAFGLKASAAVLVPIALLLLAMEAVRRRHDVKWRGAAMLAAAVTLATAWLGVAAIYGGDFTLSGLRYAVAAKVTHAATGHAATAVLLGERSTGGWWYFYPVAFFFKTSAGLHLLLGFAALGFAIDARRRRIDWLGAELRAPAVALFVIGAVLLTARINIGFRHALPLLPFIVIFAAVGTLRLWPRVGPVVRALAVAAPLWSAAYALSWYPHFLPFTSEYGPERDRGYTVFIDSNLDWGQGLIALRRYMAAHGVEEVSLSYFGSAWPQGYGIDYRPLNSFFPLPVPPEPPADSPMPELIVVSATNLQGAYFPDDPFERIRSMRPDTVLAHTLFVFRLRPDSE